MPLWMSLIVLCLEVVYTKQNKVLKLDHIGYGYDIFKGNPINHGTDPGFRSALFDLSTVGKARADLETVEMYGKRYTVTKAVRAHATPGRSQTRVITWDSMKDYVAQLDSEFGAADDDHISKKVAFVSSSECGKMKQLLEGGFIGRGHSRAIFMYYAGLQMSPSTRFRADFIDALQNLPSTHNEAKLKAFTETFGTHYISDAILGADFGHVDMINRRTLRQAEITFESGAKFPPGGSQSEVAPSIFEKPGIVAYTLRNIVNLLETQKFDTIDAADIRKKAVALKEYQVAYCGEQVKSAGLDSKLCNQ